MSPDVRTGLRALAASLPPETPIPIPAGTVLELLADEGHAQPAPTGEPDRMLTLDEAAQRLNVEKRFFTEHRRELPFLKKLVPGGTVRISEREFNRWLATR